MVGGYAFYNRVLAPGSGPPSLLEEERLAKAGATPPSSAPARQGAAVAGFFRAAGLEQVPLTIRTDGEYVWTGPVTYYVQTYGVAPDPDFLAHVRAQGYEARTPTDDEIAAAAKVFAPPA